MTVLVCRIKFQICQLCLLKVTSLSQLLNTLFCYFHCCSLNLVSQLVSQLVTTIILLSEYNQLPDPCFPSLCSCPLESESRWVSNPLSPSKHHSHFDHITRTRSSDASQVSLAEKKEKQSEERPPDWRQATEVQPLGQARLSAEWIRRKLPAGWIR